MTENILKKAKRIHVIGIGGIGVSAIAKMLLLEGKQVSGSDMSESKAVIELRKAGAIITIGHSLENIKDDIDLVIYTIAINSENPELNEAKKRGIMHMSYPETLKIISEEKFTIAISGTHGKTTTTAMVAKIMIDAGFDPTVIVGSFLKDHQSNFIAGKSKYLIVEACEFKKSFLNIEPDIAIITNIDNDHLDFYKDIEEIKSAFHEFLMKIPKDGYVICDSNKKDIKPVLENIKAEIIDVRDDTKDILKLKIPGKHNQDNARMAISVAKILGIPEEKAERSLEDFSGTWRRFEYKGETKNGSLVYDDYAHHPTEIIATLSGAKELYPDKKIFILFQPHLFSRTRLLFHDFINCFKGADTIIFLPIYAGRESFDPSISSEMLSDKIDYAKTMVMTKEDAEIYLTQNLNKDDVLISMGAGDIYKISEKILAAE